MSKKVITTAAVVGTIGLVMLLGAGYASATGWGVPKAPSEDKRMNGVHDDDMHRGHGGFYIFYGSRGRGVRHVGGRSVSGGGFRGGK